MSLDARINEVLEALRNNDETGVLRKAVDALLHRVEDETGRRPATGEAKDQFDFLKQEMTEDDLRKELISLSKLHNRY